MARYYVPSQFSGEINIAPGMAAGNQMASLMAQMKQQRRQNAIEDESRSKRNMLGEILARNSATGATDWEGVVREASQSGLGMEAMGLAREMNPPKEYTLGEIGAGDDMVQSVVFDKRAGSFKPVGDPRRKSSMPDWMMPGYIDTQRALAEAKGEGRMSPTAQKELFESDETVQAASNVIGLLNKAKEINSKASYGPFSKERAKLASWMPGESPTADATIDLDNIMTGQALESLKLIFGGMPTEGERKILLDLQASVDKTPQQRDAILDRAIELAQRRMSFNKSKADSLRSGKYFKEGPQISPVEMSGQADKKPNVGGVANANLRIPKGARTATDTATGRKVYTIDNKTFYDAETGKRVE